MGPLALKAFLTLSRSKDPADRRWARVLSRSQHFMISPVVWDTAAQMVQAASRAGESWDDILVEPQMPADMVVLETPAACYSLLRGPNEGVDGVQIVILAGYLKSGKVGFADPEQVGTFLPAKGTMRGARLCDGRPKDDRTEIDLIGMALTCERILSLISLPRLTRLSPPSTMERRRLAEKVAYHDRPQAWHRVGWTVAADVSAKDSDADPHWHNPLHYCRAHWRRAKQGQPKAEFRTDARVPGWYAWIPGSWRGHPDFGIRLHHYTPRLNDADRGLVGPVAANALAGADLALAAAGRSALRDAGFTLASRTPA